MGQLAMTGNLLTKLSFQWPHILWSYFPGLLGGKNLMTSSFIYLLVCHCCINVSLFRKFIHIFIKGWRLATAFAPSVVAVGCSTITIPSTWLPIFTKFELSISHITPSQTMCVKLAYRLKSHWKGWRWIDPQMCHHMNLISLGHQCKDQPDMHRYGKGTQTEGDSWYLTLEVELFLWQIYLRI